MSVKTANTGNPILELLVERWSPYAFDARPVSQADLRSIFEAARWAPSSYNEQPWRYIVATKEQPAEFEKLLSCLVEGNQVWAKNAPVLALGVVVQSFSKNGKDNRAAEHDLGLASACLTVEAEARGLGVHQMIGILPDKARELYAIPAGIEALTGLAIGYKGKPEQAPEAVRERDLSVRQRRPLKETVFGGAFGDTAAWLLG